MKNCMYFSQTLLKSSILQPKEKNKKTKKHPRHTFTLSQKSTKAVKSHFLEYATLYFRIASYGKKNRNKNLITQSHKLSFANYFQ